MPKIKIIDRTKHAPFNYRIKEEDQRKVNERRKANRRAREGERREIWISTVKPKQGADGYYYIDYPMDYHIEFLRGQRERRKIIRYYHKDGGYLCVTERRNGTDRRKTEPAEQGKPKKFVERRGNQFEVVPVTGSANDIPGYEQLRKIAKGIDAQRKRGR